MLLPRTSVRSALLILLLLFILLQTPGRCHAAARHRGSGPRAEARGGLHSLAQLAGRYRSGPVGFSGHEAAGAKRPSRSNHGESRQRRVSGRNQNNKTADKTVQFLLYFTLYFARSIMLPPPCFKPVSLCLI